MNDEVEEILPPEPINRINSVLKLPVPGVCGVVNFAPTVIYGGQRTRIFQHPWLALLEYSKRKLIIQP